MVRGKFLGVFEQRLRHIVHDLVRHAGAGHEITVQRNKVQVFGLTLEDPGLKCVTPHHRREVLEHLVPLLLRGIKELEYTVAHRFLDGRSLAAEWHQQRVHAPRPDGLIGLPRVGSCNNFDFILVQAEGLNIGVHDQRDLGQRASLGDYGAALEILETFDACSLAEQQPAVAWLRLDD